MAAAALTTLLPLLLASSTLEVVVAAAVQPNSTATATMVDLLAAGAGDLTCPEVDTLAHRAPTCASATGATDAWRA